MGKDAMTEEEYSSLKEFFGFFSARFFPPAHMKGVLESLTEIERTAPKRAMAGLKMAINDCIEMSSGLTREDVRSLDSDLRALSIPTLTELRRKYSREHARIVKRGEIRTLEEYYFMKGILDGAVWAMNLEEQSILLRMLEEYEEKFKPGP